MIMTIENHRNLKKYLEIRDALKSLPSAYTEQFGQIVWAKMPSYPYWPATIRRVGQVITVRFLVTSNIGQVPRQNVIPFEARPKWCMPHAHMG